VNPSRISASERFAAGGGVVVLIGLFMKWFDLNLPLSGTVAGVTLSVSGWHAVTTLRWLLLLTALFAIGLALAKGYGKEVELPIPPSVALTGLGGLSVLWILARLVDHPAPHLSVKLGLFVSLVGAVVVTVGGRQMMDEAGASFDEIRARVEELIGWGRGRKPPGGG
jgi:hypothetical protein